MALRGGKYKSLFQIHTVLTCAGKRGGAGKRHSERESERKRQTEVKVCTRGEGVDDWGEAGAISYAFTPAVLAFCIYETLSIPKVKDQRTESKAFSEWGAEFQGDVESCEACSLSSHLPLYSIPLPSLSTEATGLDWMWKKHLFQPLRSWLMLEFLLSKYVAAWKACLPQPALD